MSDYQPKKSPSQWISIQEAAHHAPYSQEYLSLLARRGKIFAKKIGRNWYTTHEALARYVSEQALLSPIAKQFNSSVELADAPSNLMEEFKRLNPQVFSNQNAKPVMPNVAPVPVVPSAPVVVPAPIIVPVPTIVPENNSENAVLQKLDRLSDSLENFASSVTSAIPAITQTSQSALLDPEVEEFIQERNSSKIHRFKHFDRFSKSTVRSPVGMVTIAVSAIVLLFVLIGGFSFGQVDAIAQKIKKAFTDATTIDGHFAGTHANEVLVLDKAGNVSIYGHIETEGQLRSHAPEGVAPIVVDSMTKVENLNADYFDNLDAKDFTLAFVTKNGNLTYEDVHLMGDVEVGKLLKVGGSALIGKTLTVSGATKLLDSLTVYGKLGVLSDAVFGKDVTLTNGNLVIGKGTIKISNMTLVKNLNAEYLDGVKKGDINLQFVTSNGSVTSNAITVGGLNVNGTSNFNGVGFFNNGVWGSTGSFGTLGVAGSTSIGDKSNPEKSSFTVYSKNFSVDANGNTSIAGRATTGNLLVGGSILSSLIPSGSYDLGSLGQPWQNLYVVDGNFSGDIVVSGSLNFAGTSSSSFVINTDNATADTENSYIRFNRGTVTPSAILSWNTASKSFNFNEPLNVASGSFTVAVGPVGIGTTSPNVSALLDLTSTTRGLLGPRMTQAQRDAISTPPAGLLIFNTDTNTYNTYNGSTWLPVGALKTREGSTNVQLNSNTLTFSPSGFTVTASGSTDTLVGIDYINGPASRSIAQSITGLWTFVNGASVSTNFEVGGYASIGGNLFVGGTSTLSGLLSFSGTNHAGLELNNLTTTQRDLLTPASGMTLFNTTVAKMQVYNGTTWKNVGNPEIGAEVTGGTGGSVLFVDGSGNLGQDNDNFYWDVTNQRLGIGTKTPTTKFEVQGTASASYGLFGTLQVGGFSSASYNRFGTSTTLQGLTSADDLLISGKLEVLGSTYFSNSVFTNASVSNNFEVGGYASISNTLFVSNGQVGIGTTSPNASALLDLTSTTRGLLGPRMTQAQRDAISTPPAGLLIFNTDTNTYNTYNGSTWLPVGALKTKEGGTTILPNANTLTFSPSGFTVTASGSTDTLVGIDYDNGPASRSIAQSITGLWTFVNGASVSTNFEVGGYASVGGNATIGGTLGVTGNMILTGTLTGNSTGSNSFAGSLDITKGLRANYITATSGLISNSLTAYNGGPLTIGAFTLGGLVTGNNQNILGLNQLTATIASVSTNFEVGGYASIGGNIMTGGILVGSGTGSNSFAGSLDITKGLRAAQITGTGLGITGNGSFTGSLSAGATNLSSLTVTGQSNFANASSSGTFEATSNLIANNVLQIGGTSATSYSRFGTGVTASGLSSNSDLLVTGSLEVLGNTYLSGISFGTASVSGAFEVGGAIKASDGTAGAPSYTFSNDEDTGLFRIGTNNLGFTTGGVQRFRIGDAGASLSVPFELSSTASIGGNTTIAGTLVGTNTGSNSFAGSLDITKGLRAAQITGTGLIVNGNSNLDGTLTVTGQSNFANASSSGTFEATSNLIANNVLQIGGTTATSYSRFGTGTTTHSNYLNANNDLLVSGDLEVTGTASFEGNVVIGATSTTTLAVNSTVKSDLIPFTNAFSLGSTTNHWNTLYVDTAYISMLSAPTASISGTTANDFLINSDNVSADTEPMSLTFKRGSPTINSAIQWDITNKLFNFNFPILVQTVDNPEPIYNFTNLTLKGAVDQGAHHYFDIQKNNGEGLLAVGSTGWLSASSSFQAGGGSLATASYSRFGTGTTAHGLSTPADLLASNKFEVGGLSFFDDVATFTAGASISSNLELTGTASLSGAFVSSYTGSNSFAGSLNIAKSLTTTNSVTAGSFVTAGNLTVGGDEVLTGTFTGNSTGSNSFLGSLDITKGLRSANYTQVGTGTSYFNGNLGVGTTAPNYKFEVATTGATTAGISGNLTGSDGVYSTLNFKNTSGLASITARREVDNFGTRLDFSTGLANTFGGAANNSVIRMTIDNQGNVGVGTQNVDAKFEVAGTASISGTVTLGGIITSTNTGSNSFQGSIDANLGIHAVGNITTLAQFLSSGVGSNSFAGSLNLEKGVHATGNVTTTEQIFSAGTGSNSFAGSINLDKGLHALGNVTTEGQFISTGTASNSFAGSLELTKGLRFGNLTQTGTASNSFVGAVGIGTATPLALLDIYSANAPTIKVRSANTSGGRIILSSSTSDWTTYVQNQDFRIYDGAVGAGDRFTIAGLTGSVGIGTTAPVARLDVAGDLNYPNVPLFRVASASGIAQFYITKGGNVGIGTTVPAYKLDVVGDVNLPTSSHYKINGVDVDFDKWVAGTGNDIYRQNGNVGIGTTVPSTKFEVQGTASASYGLFGTLQVAGFSSASYSRFGTTATTHGLSATNDLLVNGKLEVDGSAYFDGTTNFSIASSSYFYAADGTAASPSFSFRADQNTGLYRKAADSFSITTGGAERLNLTNTTASISNTLYINSAGNVGIGTTGPTYPLDIYNASKIQAVFHGYDPVGGAANYNGAIAIGAQTGAQGLIHYNNGGQTDLYIDNTYTGDATSKIHFRNGTTDQMVITATGNVGIGTTGPSSYAAIANKFVLYAGAANQGLSIINTTGGWAGSIAFGDGTGDTAGARGVIQYQNNDTPANAAFAFTSAGTFNFSAGGVASNLVLKAGNVGIGTTGPSGRLHVMAPSGNVFAARFSTNDWVSGSTGSDFGISFGASSGDTYTVLNALKQGANLYSNLVLQSGGGNVGIGTTNPSTNTLQVTGSAGKTVGGTSWQDLSDARLKNVLGNLNGTSLDTLMKLRPIKYEWNDLHKQLYGNGNDTVMYGFLAQEIKDVIPQMVTVGGDGYYWYNPSGFESLLTAGVQELNNKVGSLAGQFEAFTAQMEAQCVTGETRLRRRRKKKGTDSTKGNVGTGADDYDEVRIDEIEVGDEIWSLNETTGRVEFARVNALMDMGVQEVYELVTASGRKIRTTKNHPYLAQLGA